MRDEKISNIVCSLKLSLLCIKIYSHEFYSYFSVFFTRMYSYVFVCILCIVCIRMYSYVPICYSYASRIISRTVVVCIRMFRMLLVCYPYVLVWCLSHDRRVCARFVMGGDSVV